MGNNKEDTRTDEEAGAMLYEAWQNCPPKVNGSMNLYVVKTSDLGALEVVP